MTAVAIAILAGLAAIAGAFVYVGLRFLHLCEDLGRDALQRQDAARLVAEEVPELYEEYPAGVYRIDVDTAFELMAERDERRDYAARDPYSGMDEEIMERLSHG